MTEEPEADECIANHDDVSEERAWQLAVALDPYHRYVTLILEEECMIAEAEDSWS